MANKDRPTVNKWRKTKHILLHYYHSLLEINILKKTEGEFNNRGARIIKYFTWKY